MIELLDHGNPHGAAAAGELELVFIVDVLVEFQGFFQCQDIGKDGDFQHTRETQALESCPQFPHGNIGTELTGYGRSNQGVDRAVVVVQFLDDRDEVFPRLQGIELAGIDAAWQPTHWLSSMEMPSGPDVIAPQSQASWQ